MARTKSDAGSLFFIACTLVLVVLPLDIAWNGYTLCMLWKWFVAGPLGLPSLSIAEAMGMCVFVTLVIPQRHNEKSDDEGLTEVLAKVFSRSFFHPAFLLLIGWILSFFV